MIRLTINVSALTCKKAKTAYRFMWFKTIAYKNDKMNIEIIIP